MAKYEKILMLQNDIEAQRFSAILDEEGITHRVVSYHDTAYDGLFQMQFGWGHLEAAPEDGPRIRELYGQFTDADAP